MKRYAGFLFLTLGLLSGCGGYPDDIDLDAGLDEPDRTLYDRAVYDMDRGQHTRARLLFQNLINTYPDSEYLPLAKYGIGETFYHVGTRADLTQAEAEFKDFITFFPTSEYADDAQLMVAMTHVRQMEKADRDPTQALLAETELRNFISSYPDSQHLEEAKEKLRAVQEVLAEGVLKVGNFYTTVGNYGAAVDRYLELLEKYPDYSDTPEALYQLAEAMRRGQNEGEAIVYYNRIIRNHPLSDVVEDASERLAQLDQPIPDANPAALARAEAAPPNDGGKSLFAKMFGLWSRRPDVSTETTAASILESQEEGEGEGAGEGTFEVEGTIIESETPSGQE